MSIGTPKSLQILSIELTIDLTRSTVLRGRRMTGSAGTAMDVLVAHLSLQQGGGSGGREGVGILRWRIYASARFSCVLQLFLNVFAPKKVQNSMKKTMKSQ